MRKWFWWFFWGMFGLRRKRTVTEGKFQKTSFSALYFTLFIPNTFASAAWPSLECIYESLCELTCTLLLVINFVSQSHLDSTTNDLSLRSSGLLEIPKSVAHHYLTYPCQSTTLTINPTIDKHYSNIVVCHTIPQRERQISCNERPSNALEIVTAD